MIDIIDNIEKIISDTPMVLICGDMYIYNKTEIEAIIREKYSEKKKNFERMFQSEKRICPYQFYTKGNSIKFRVNQIVQKIKRMNHIM